MFIGEQQQQPNPIVIETSLIPFGYVSVASQPAFYNPSAVETPHVEQTVVSVVLV